MTDKTCGGVGCDRPVKACGWCVKPNGRSQHLGYFDTPEAAHLAWRNRKLELALELKPKMDEIDTRIHPRVVEIIRNAK